VAAVRRANWLGDGLPSSAAVHGSSDRGVQDLGAAAGATVSRLLPGLISKVTPAEVITDQAPLYPAVLETLLPAAWHRTDQYANNGIECDHGRLKAWLRPMRGLKQDRSISVMVAGHAFMQNLRRGHYELAIEEPANRRVAVAIDELALMI
jgi:transposase-like protein